MTFIQKICVAVFMALFVVILAVIAIVGITTRQDSLEAFRVSSTRELQWTKEYINMFLTDVQRNTAYLASLSVSDVPPGRLPLYVGRKEATLVPVEDMTPEARAAYQAFALLRAVHPQYGTVILGAADGGFLQEPAEAFPAGFDHRSRGWYKETLGSATGTTLSKAYRLPNGTAVSTACTRVRREGRDRGVVGIDINLSTLMEATRQARFGATGYIMLVEDTGVILSDPGHEDFTFKSVRETGIPLYARMMDVDEGVLEGDILGTDMFLNVMQGPHGWKLVAVTEAAEVYASGWSLIKKIALIGLGTALLLGVAAVWLIARGVRGQLGKDPGELNAIARRVVNGDYEVDDGGRKSGVYGSLVAMVEALKTHIETARRESENAGEQSHAAREAMEKAETTGREARARAKAMLEAADRLEGVGGVVSSASAELSARIEQSDRGAAEAARRLAEAAAAMNQMNATVRDVARSAGTASSASAETREKALAGAAVVEQAVGSIERVQEMSLGLKEDMARLNEHARDITRIMSVISDIADQTNLLALNAAIEAARAGEAGRGFAVVADEVRKLAEKTMTSTQDVGNAIRAIQESTAKSMEGVDQSVARIGEATEQARRCGRALREIVSTVEATADQVNAIATASEEQAAASEAINRTIIEVNDTAGQTARAMGRAAEAVADLAAQARGLTELIRELKEA